MEAHAGFGLYGLWLASHQSGLWLSYEELLASWLWMPSEVQYHGLLVVSLANALLTKTSGEHPAQGRDMIISYYLDF